MRESIVLNFSANGGESLLKKNYKIYYQKVFDISTHFRKKYLWTYNSVDFFHLSQKLNMNKIIAQ